MNVNYDKLADTYDNHRGAGGPYLAILLRLAETCRATRVLELGAGTGNNDTSTGAALTSNHGGGVVAAFCDGHVIFLRSDLESGVMNLLIRGDDCKNENGPVLDESMFN